MNRAEGRKQTSARSATLARQPGARVQERATSRDEAYAQDEACAQEEAKNIVRTGSPSGAMPAELMRFIPPDVPDCELEPPAGHDPGDYYAQLLALCRQAPPSNALAFMELCDAASDRLDHVRLRRGREDHLRLGTLKEMREVLTFLLRPLYPAADVAREVDDMLRQACLGVPEAKQALDHVLARAGLSPEAIWAEVLFKSMPALSPVEDLMSARRKSFRASVRSSVKLSLQFGAGETDVSVAVLPRPEAGDFDGGASSQEVGDDASDEAGASDGPQPSADPGHAQRGR